MGWRRREYSAGRFTAYVQSPEDGSQTLIIVCGGLAPTTFRLSRSSVVGMNLQSIHYRRYENDAMSSCKCSILQCCEHPKRSTPYTCSCICNPRVRHVNACSVIPPTRLLGYQTSAVLAFSKPSRPFISASVQQKIRRSSRHRLSLRTYGRTRQHAFFHFYFIQFYFLTL